MRVDRLDHFVLTVADTEATIDFYTRVLGMTAVTFGGGRRALRFGSSKINLHQAGDPLVDVVAELADAGVPVEVGPVDRAGAPARSPASICGIRTET